MACVDLLRTMDAVVLVMHEQFPRYNWRVMQMTQGASGEMLRSLVRLSGAVAAKELRHKVMLDCVGPPGVFFTGAECVHPDCCCDDVDREKVKAMLAGANMCSVCHGLAYAVVKSLLAEGNEIVIDSKSKGRGRVVGAGLIGCRIRVSAEAVHLFRESTDADWDHAMTVHENPPLHEFFFADVCFCSGSVERLYIELTPGQVHGFDASGLKATFWEVPAAYSDLHERTHAEIVHGYAETFPVPGWEDYMVVMRRVCAHAFDSESLRRVPMRFLAKYM